jgi:hypothetical protein
MSSTGQGVGGIVGAVIGFVVTGGNPMGAVWSSAIPGRTGHLIMSAKNDSIPTSKNAGDDQS